MPSSAATVTSTPRSNWRLREIGFPANRRLLCVETISHDCCLGARTPCVREVALQKLQGPLVVDGQRTSGLRFGDVRVQALLHTLVLFCHVPVGFAREPKGFDATSAPLWRNCWDYLSAHGRRASAI